MTSTPTATLVSEVESEAVVSAVTTPAEGIVELTLSAADGGTLPGWTPGAHIDVILKPDLVRQYSLCGQRHETSYRIAVLLSPESRGGSQGVHHLTEGDTVRIRGPRNNFPMLASKSYIFIAGGIGVTPMLPMIEAAEAAGADWHVFYGGRSEHTMAYLDQLRQYGDRVTAVAQDQQGVLDVAAILAEPRANTLIYCCGPEPLLAAVEEHSRRWPAGALHLERFSAKDVQRDGADTDFEVVLQRSGKTIQVRPDQTVFEAMREADVSVLGSCLEGVCGTCEVGVLDGEVDHRDSVLDEEEQEEMDCMMVCVSRCKGTRLVLDA
ncbi:MAG: PDR/VanB family oxidoreductase [Ornithinimicrobium sp.]